MSAQRLVPRRHGLYGSGDSAELVTDADAAKLEAVVEAAIELRKWGVSFQDDRLDYIEVQVNKADVEAFESALAALKEAERG